MKTRLFAAVLLLTAPSLAMAQSTMKGMDMKSASSPATQEYMHAMQGMQQAMQGMTPTNDPNKDFVMMMKPHHQAAVEMAKSYLRYGDDPKLMKMAKDIVSSQIKEIKEMSEWQAKHGMASE